MPIKSYRDLTAWQKAMDLVVEVYQETRGLPKAEVHGLTAQIRRSAVSIPSNIAEGQGTHSDGSFGRHLAIAHGSLCELETQLMLAGRLGFVARRVWRRCWPGRLRSAVSSSASTRY